MCTHEYFYVLCVGDERLMQYGATHLKIFTVLRKEFKVCYNRISLYNDNRFFLL